MAVTIDGNSFPNLTAQPYGFDGPEITFGRSYRQWTLEGICSEAEFIALTNSYSTYQAAKILEDVPTTSGVVGTTVLFSGTGPNSTTWTNIPVWYTEAPAGEQAGQYIRVTVALSDAAQHLAALQQAEADSGQADADDLPDLGTFVYGGTTITLTSPLNGYREGPTVELTAAQTHFISGAQVIEKLRILEGYFEEDAQPNGLTQINTQYETDLVATPTTGQYYPISPPSYTAEKRTNAGVDTVRYTVSMQFIEVI